MNFVVVGTFDQHVMKFYVMLNLLDLTFVSLYFLFRVYWLHLCHAVDYHRKWSLVSKNKNCGYINVLLMEMWGKHSGQKYAACIFLKTLFFFLFLLNNQHTLMAIHNILSFGRLVTNSYKYVLSHLYNLLAPNWRLGLGPSCLILL